MRILVGIWFWVMAFCWTALLYLGCAVQQLRVKLGALAPDGRGVHAVASVWGRGIMALTPGWRASVEGSENIPADGKPHVIVANHESMCDIFAMYYLGLQFRWLSKAEVFKIPFVGHAMTWAGYVPVRRGQTESQRLAMEESAKRLRLGVSMFFFPEGTRSKDGQVKEFKSGAFRLAQSEQAPVLPVAIHGAGSMLRKGSWLPGRSHVRIRVLPPIPPPAPSDDLGVYAERVRSQIIAAHAALF